ncbi:DUF1453 family protein [Cohnella lubricantis]|uniref:DUF1453 family protein n=2 Tax=Cohnella lubricantis TaxID=2163172 RepID=A0A841T8Z8_9BACL|nr:DUF1453 family protein [Cohnella lubricantis]
MIVVIVLVFWLRSRRTGRARPIRRNGFGMLIPVVVLLAVFSSTITALTHDPEQPFHYPAAWEMLIAGLVGLVLGGVMLYHTRYEKREDGQVYTIPNPYFKYILLAIIAIRLALSEYFKTLDSSSFALLAMMMAFLYIAVWRIGSFVKYRKIRAS